MSTGDTLFSLFFLIGLGYLARRTLLVGQPLATVNTFVYYFAVPALLFNSAIGIAAEQLFKPYFISAFLLAAAITAAVTLIGSRLLLREKTESYDKARMVVQALTATFANYAYMGIPLVFGLLGENSYAATITVILAGNLFLVAGAQLMLEVLQPSAGNPQRSRLVQGLQLLDRSLLRSPVFLATVAGVTVSAMGWQLPQIIATPLNMLAPAAIPVALFCLGASLEFKAIGKYRVELIWMLLIKLVLHPLITLITLQLMGITDPDWLIPTVLLTALPTGALAHVIAARYQIAEQVTSLTIVLSTLLSAVSLWGWVYWLV
ncbi:MAG: AEC family transporter [Motiliproteus sp.]